jgi:broad specificity phosphatase PhoE
MAEVVLIRHAEPSLRGVFLGSTDLGLSEFGLSQARALELDFDWPVYVSPMRRAIETAEAMGLKYGVVDGFREIDYGPWEGLSWAEIEERFPAEAGAKLDDWLGYCVDGAESWSKFRSRVAAALTQCARPCLIVAHLAVNSVIRQLLSGEPELGFQQGYCEIVKLNS